MKRIGEPLATQLKEKSLALYQAAADYAAGRGVIIADTKFEFGLLPDGKLIVVDEVSLLGHDLRFLWMLRYPSGMDPPTHRPLRFDAVILSPTRSPMTSR